MLLIDFLNLSELDIKKQITYLDNYTIYDIILYIYACHIKLNINLINFIINYKIKKKINYNFLLTTKNNFLDTIKILSKNKIIPLETDIRWFIVIYYDYSILRILLKYYKKLTYKIFLVVPQIDKKNIIKYCLLNKIKIEQNMKFYRYHIDINLDLENKCLENISDDLKKYILSFIY